MKVLKATLTVLFLAVSFMGTAQKVKLKKEQVLVDDVVWLKYEGCTGLKWTLCSLYNQKGDEVVFMKFIKRGNASDNMVFNRGGDPNYFEVTFLGTGKKIELRDTPENIAGILYKSKCINEDGTFNNDAVDRLVEKYGNSYSNK